MQRSPSSFATTTILSERDAIKRVGPLANGQRADDGSDAGTDLGRSGSLLAQEEVGLALPVNLRVEHLVFEVHGGLRL